MVTANPEVVMLPCLQNWPGTSAVVRSPRQYLTDLKLLTATEEPVAARVGNPAYSKYTCYRNKDNVQLHLSKFPTEFAPRRTLIVGKGPSIGLWHTVPDIDAVFTCNEATYAVNRQHFHCRGDGNRKEHRFCDWIPSYAVPIIPQRIRHLYSYGYWFSWNDIGDGNICLTTVQALRLAYWMGSRDITFVGCDALFNATTQYASGYANIRNIRNRFKEQRNRFARLPQELLACCHNYDGTMLTDALQVYIDDCHRKGIDPYADTK